MKELRFEYRGEVEWVNWVGNTNEAGSSTVDDLRKSQPGTWALAEPAYNNWKAEVTKPETEAAKQKKAALDKAAEEKKAAEDKAAEDKTARDKAAKEKAARDKAAEDKAAEDKDDEDVNAGRAWNKKDIKK